MLKSARKETLRRVSFRIISWCFTVVLGTAAAGVGVLLIDELESGSPDGGTPVGLAACLGTVALIRRIVGSRIVLRESTLTIINPLLTYTVPYRAITEVTQDTGGTLGIVTQQGDEIYSTGFGGSIIDHFVGSTERAREKIENRIRRRRGGEQTEVTRKITISWVADVCTVLAAASAVAAGVIGI